VDTSIGRCFWIAALALAACHSDEDATSVSGGPSLGGTTDGEIDAAPEICQAYADHLQMCEHVWHAQVYAAQAFGRCAAELSVSSGLGPDCNDADEDYFACLSAIECAALEDPTLVCGDQRDAKELACSGGSVDSSSSG
jgi:hypothetical protein